MTIEPKYPSVDRDPRVVDVEKMMREFRDRLWDAQWEGKQDDAAENGYKYYRELHQQGVRYSPVF